MNDEEKKLIYVCSPYAGKDENYNRALQFGKYVVMKGHIPIIPHTMLHGILDDANHLQRATGLYAGRRLLKICDEVWVFGSERTASIEMKSEIELSAQLDIPVKYIDVTSVWGADKRAMMLGKCLRHYENTYLTVNSFIAEDIKRYFDNGIDADLICECINLAAIKNANWKYSKAILDACIRGNIYTLNQYIDSKAKKKAKSNYAGYDLNLFEQMLNKDN